MRTISQVVGDIYDVLTNDTDHRLTDAEVVAFSERLISPFQRAVSNESRDRKKKVIYASELGKPCLRQIYYNHNSKEEAEPLNGDTRFKFMYGDYIEEIALELAAAAGHDVSGQQQEFEHKLDDGWRVRGRCDAIIDGHMVDVKSASSFAFRKYTKNGIHDGNDNFGYRMQIAFYWNEAIEKGLIEDDSRAYFFFVNKEMGKLSMVDANVEECKPYSRALDIVEALEGKEPPPRMENYSVPEGKSGNEKLCTTCSYCPFKMKCNPDVRTFLYSNGPTFLTKVERVPKVHEVV